MTVENIIEENLQEKEMEALKLLYTFRILDTPHFHKLLHYNSIRGTQKLLSKMVEKQLIYTSYSKKLFYQGPAVYCLDKKGRAILRKDKTYDKRTLKKVYGDKEVQKEYVQKRLAIADLYLYFLKIQKPGNKLIFYTDSELVKYKYISNDLCNAYASEKTEKKTKRYLISIFEQGTLPWLYQKKVKDYLNYFNSGDWEDGTNNTPFPSVLLVFPNERKKRHIYYYAKAIFEEKFNIFLTTKNRLYIPDPKVPIWEKVE